MSSSSTRTNIPVTSTTSSTETTCAPGYNTVTYTVDSSAYAAFRSQGNIPPIVDMVFTKLSDNNKVSMCVKKKCPDGNYATNFGKLYDPNQNLYGCLYMPDTTTSSNGEKTLSCKQGQLLTSIANKFGVPTNDIPEICVSSPQIYFPKLQ